MSEESGTMVYLVLESQEKLMKSIPELLESHNQSGLMVIKEKPLLYWMT